MLTALEKWLQFYVNILYSLPLNSSYNSFIAFLILLIVAVPRNIWCLNTISGGFSLGCYDITPVYGKLHHPYYHSVSLN